MIDGIGPPARLGVSRVAVLIWGPVALAVASWIYLSAMLIDPTTMPGMSPMAMDLPMAFSPTQMFGLLVMWVVMMTAMMLPTALPLILGYARMRAGDAHSWLFVLSLSLGYATAWSAFSIGATLLQAGLSMLSVLSPMRMALTSPPVAGAFLLGAGMYQFTPFKDACLGHCRSPRRFLATQWREGQMGAFMMGWRHGLFCVGCCWALMAVLLVAGVMNVFFIIAVTAFVLAEKILPFRRVITFGAGSALMGAGIWTVAQAF